MRPPSRLAFVLLALCAAMIPPARAAVNRAPAAEEEPIVVASTGLRALPPADVAAAGEWSRARGADAALDAFRARHGGAWEATWDRRSGHVFLVWGSGIPLLPGAGNALAGDAPAPAEVEARVRRLLAEAGELHALRDDELVLSAARSGALDGGRLWLVDFDRAVGGVPVEGSRVFARLVAGNVVQIGFERVFPVDPELARPQLGAPGALARAFAQAGGREAGDEVVEQGRLLLLPELAPDGGYRARLVWESVFRRAGIAGVWTARVDARDGQVVELFDATRNVAGTVRGLVRPRRPGEPEELRPFPLQSVQVASQTVVTDAAGYFSAAPSGTVSFALAGLAPPGGFRVTNLTGPSAFAVDASGSSAVDLVWSDANSRADERTAFWHLHAARAHARRFVGALPLFETVLPAGVNDDVGACRASWDGQALAFTGPGGGCASAGESADIVLHEWGHALEQHLGGASDPAGSEAMADTTAWLVTRSPVFAPGYLEPAAQLVGALADPTAWRDASQPVTIANLAERCPRASPPACAGALGHECHCEGLVLSGAAWDLVQLLVARAGEFSAFETAARLHYLALPAWTSYLEAYDAYLAVDDDNGDLSDGTPNGCLIHEAFARHGLAGSPAACSAPLVRLELAGSALLETVGDGDGSADPGESVALRLRVANRGNALGSSVKATLSVSAPGVRVTRSTASFPPLAAGAEADSLDPHVALTLDASVPCGTLVPLELALSDGTSVWRSSVELLVGRPLATVYEQAFEADSGWTGDGGSARRGQWVAGSPGLTANLGDVYQPGSCAQGVRCLHTGANARWDLLADDDVDDGSAVAESPEIDLAGVQEPVLQFRYWFVSLRAAQQPADVFQVEVADATGPTLVFSESTSRSEWRTASVPLRGRVTPGVPVRLRFVATDDAAAWNVVEAAIDDVRIVDLDCDSGATCAFTAAAAAAGPTGLCDGESVTLLASVTGCARPSFQWRDNGVDVPGAVSPSFTPGPGLAPGSHRFEVLVGCDTAPGCSLVAGPVVVTVAGARAVVAGPDPIPLCGGERPLVDGSGSSVEGCPGGALFQWLVGGAEVPGATAPVLELPSLPPGEHPVALRVACASSPRCAATSAPVTASVVGVTASVVGPGAVPVCAGESVSLDGRDSRAENCPVGLSYIWYEGLFSVGAGPTFTSGPLSEGPHVYELVTECASRPRCKATSAPVSVVVSAAAPRVGENGLRLARRGAEAQLAWSASGTGTWNVHRTAAALDVPLLWQTPPAGTSATGVFAEPLPAGSWFYAVYGADCRGISVP